MILGGRLRGFHGVSRVVRAAIDSVNVADCSSDPNFSFPIKRVGMKISGASLRCTAQALACVFSRIMEIVQAVGAGGRSPMGASFQRP